MVARGRNSNVMLEGEGAGLPGGNSKPGQGLIPMARTRPDIIGQQN